MSGIQIPSLAWVHLQSYLLVCILSQLRHVKSLFRTRWKRKFLSCILQHFSFTQVYHLVIFNFVVWIVCQWVHIIKPNSFFEISTATGSLLLLLIIFAIIMIEFRYGGIAVAHGSILNCHLQVLKNVRKTTSDLGDESCCSRPQSLQHQLDIILWNSIEQQAIVVRKVTCHLFRIWRRIRPNQVPKGEVLSRQKPKLINVQLLQQLKRSLIKQYYGANRPLNSLYCRQQLLRVQRHILVLLERKVLVLLSKNWEVRLLKSEL